MGTPIRDFTVREEVTLAQLRDKGNTPHKTASIDLYTWLHQFLSKIRSYDTGDVLRNEDGEITSHLSGLYYRSMNLLEYDIQPVFVAEGDAPELKEEELQDRRESREKNRQKYKIAQAIGDKEKLRELDPPDAVSVNDQVLESAFELIDLMGCPVIIPPSEAEAQCARMCSDGLVDYVISSDYDTLLFGSPNLVQNLNSSGGEYIDLDECLTENDLSHRELLWLGILLGTDFNTSPYGVGPKRARGIVEDASTLGDVIEKAKEFDDSINEDRWRATFDLFISPDVDTDIVDEVVWELPDKEGLKDFLIEKNGFSETRVNGAMDGVVVDEGDQHSLSGF